MIERFTRAVAAKKPFNAIRKENNTYLIRNIETFRIYYVQNYQELISVLQFVNPHLKKTAIPYKNSFFTIGKWECVIEENGSNDHIYLAEKRVIVVRSPAAVLGLL